MKYQSLGLLILCGLLIFSTQAISQKQPAADKTPKIARLSQKELNQLAKQLAATGLQQFTHRAYSVDAKGVAKLDKEGTVRGLFLMRSPAFMKKLHNGFYDDLQGNLIYFGHFNGSQKKDIHYSASFDGIGDVVLALDFNHDGLVDLIIGRSQADRFFTLNDNVSLPLFQQCFDRSLSGVFGDPLSCARDPKSTKPGGPGGPTPDVADEPDSFGAFIGGQSKPNCQPKLGGNVRMVPPMRLDDEISLLGDAGNRAMDAARAAREAHRPIAQRDFEEMMRDAFGAQDALQHSRSAPSEGERHTAYVDYLDQRQAYSEARLRAQHDTGEPTDTSVLGVPAPERGPGGGGVPPSPGSGSHKTPVPDEGEDPRCGPSQAEIKRGFWFMDKKFCPDGDFLDCWARSEDAIRDATQGRCHTETGPDDSRTLVCGKSEAEKDPIAPQPPDPVSGHADDPPGHFSISPQPRGDYKFVVPGPLGALLAVQCAQVDGCGGMEGLKKAKPGNQP
jgi:hypothetical protein